MPKKIPPHIKEKAIQLRLEKNLTVPEIAKMLSVSVGTVDSWMKDYPLEERTQKQTEAQKRGTKAMQEKFAALRDTAYSEAWQEAPKLFKDPEFRDFINMYLAEGYKKSRNQVTIANSDPDVMVMANYYMNLYANPENTMEYRIQIHIDQDENELKKFWGKLLSVPPEKILTMRKSNSGQLSGRNWRSKYGVLTIRIGDTAFRSKLQAWMDFLKKKWLDRFSKL